LGCAGDNRRVTGGGFSRSKEDGRGKKKKWNKTVGITRESKSKGRWPFARWREGEKKPSKGGERRSSLGGGKNIHKSVPDLHFRKDIEGSKLG